MIIIHIESGLGNQMLSYCEFLALKLMNPNCDFYLETIIYDIPECNKVTCQWNGYELQRIFGIQSPPNIKTLFSETEWNEIISEIKETEFWNKNMNYPVYFTEAFKRHGLYLENIKGNYEEGWVRPEAYRHTMRYCFARSYFGVTLKRLYSQIRKGKFVKRRDNRSILFIHTERNLFTGQWLSFKYIGNERWRIDEKIRSMFTFPCITDEKNLKMAEVLDHCNSVAIHARRGDMLSNNGWCYKYGYFKRAVKYIKKHVSSPVFVFFTNTGSIEWCRENEKTFGLDYRKDKVLFVDWNTGLDSYRDMQLMGHCKHAIITNSSFGWWGAYFIKNPDKITISPSIDIDTTHHC